MEPLLVHAEYYDRYVKRVKSDDLVAAFQQQRFGVTRFFDSLPNSKADYAYAAGKWTVKQLVQHLTDAERIFAYRALTFARGDEAILPGFEEDDYAVAGDVTGRSLQNIIEEFVAVRKTTELLFASFTKEALSRTGVASGNEISVASAGWVILGHFDHHKSILLERYL